MLMKFLMIMMLIGCQPVKSENARPKQIENLELGWNMKEYCYRGFLYIGSYATPGVTSTSFLTPVWNRWGQPMKCPGSGK